jgi:hypothetical protein
MHRLHFPALVAILSVALGGQAMIHAADILTVKAATIGLGGKCKAGFWQQVLLTVSAGPQGANGRLEIVASDGDQMPVAFSGGDPGELSLAANEERTARLYFKSGPVATPIVARLVNNSKVVWQVTLPIPTAIASTQELVVGLGPSIGIEPAAASIRRTAGSALATVSIEKTIDLPDRWWGYDGVDMLFLATSDERFLEELSPAQQQAIVQWVFLGGRIVLCGGVRGADIAASGSPWSALIPGEFVEVDALRDRSGLESYTKTELPFDDPLFQRNRPQVTRLKNIRGEVVLDEVSSGAGRPLAVQAPAGFGQVTFVAIDLDHPSLIDWKGRTRLVASLLSLGAATHEQNERQTHGGISQLGYTDLVGQLRAALDQFSGVAMVNFTTVSVLTCLYLLLIGPGDFLFLSRLSLPRHLTWITFPAVAAVIIGVATYVNGNVHGHSVRINQAEVVDIDMGQKLARGTVWCHLYSPVTQPFTTNLKVSSPPGVVDSTSEGWLIWQGLPGDSLGGLESRQPVLIQREPYSAGQPGSEVSVKDLTVQVASSKSLSASWWGTTSLSGESHLSIDRYGLLAGNFQSPLPIGLTDCILAHGEKLYRLGNLSVGQRVQMADLAPLNLEARLTQRRVEQTKDVSTPWDPNSTDVPRIMQMLMFHEAARGSSYTGLTHRYQSKIDCSELVRLGQAVLVGRSTDPVARLNLNEQGIGTENTTTYTWYRIILPVASARDN